MALRSFAFIFPFILLFACSPGARIESPGLQPLNAGNMNALNGNYNVSMWKYFAPLAKEKYNDTIFYKVMLEVVNDRRIAAKVVYNDSVVVAEKMLKGQLSEGYFSVKPRTLFFGIPLVYFHYYKNKIDFGVKENSSLYLSVNEFRLTNILVVSAGKRSGFSGSFKKK